MIINGNNLGERHRDLNTKVREAVSKQTRFEDLSSQPDECDVDKLFKIDLASKYKNVDYILEVLKCGDVFYITRALKCLWLYEDEYSQYINTDYLKKNVFPYMSRKMKRKTLTAVSMNVRNAARAIDFYKYCMDVKLYDYAFKFLVFTPDSFKLDVIKAINFRNFNDSKFLKQFIGNSFDLAYAYIAACDCTPYRIYLLRFLYSLSDEQYLNILETYIHNDARYPQCSERLGLRISKDILIKHKQRVLNKPLLYVNVLNTNLLVKHLTIEDVETIAVALLPESFQDYWSLDFYFTYKFILEKIPADKLFGYMKEIYTSKYNVEFEMKIEFFNLKYYEMLNIDEREAWALRHIERDKELPGIKNYIWYKFVSFPKAFSGIKRYIFLTPDKDERSRIVNVLPETARTQKDTIDILDYYYGRHVNESEEDKESFINKIIEFHDIYSFNDECWTSFDKLLYSLDVYSSAPSTRSEYKVRSLFYRILHDKEVPEALTEYIDCITHFYHLESLIEELSEERNAVVAKYLMNYFAEKVKSLMEQPDYSTVQEKDDYWESGSIKDQIQEQVSMVWSIIYCFKRPHEECPEIVVKFMEEHMNVYQYHEKYKTKFVKFSEEDFVRWLKQDVETAVNGIYEIRCNTYRWNFRLCRLFRKLKVYFPNDVGKEYLEYFTEYLSDVPQGRREYRNIKMAIVGVFYLADPDTIIGLLEKNVSTSPKIDHMNIDNRVLQVQKAICRLGYHPRPPLPLSIIQRYITGDYVHFCIPMFYNYFANLPSNDKFIESLLDAPLSIQKHGLRLAFKAYDVDSLVPIIESAWKKTKNVSLRMVLYEALFDRLINESEEVQKKLYDVLKMFTSELNHDDHEKVYSLLVSGSLPNTFKGDFIETAWLTVSRLSNKVIDIQRRINVINHMEKYIHLVEREFLRNEIINDHVTHMLCEKNINKDCGEYYFQELIRAKWHLTAKYIVTFNGEFEQQKSLHLLQTILSESLQSWSLVKYSTYTFRKFIKKFTDTIMDKDPKTVESCESIVPIYECIRNNLKSSLKTEEIYLMNWKLKLSIICRNIMHSGIKRNNADGDVTKIISNKDIFYAFGKFVAKMIVDGVENGKFHYSYYRSIADIVNNIGETMCRVLEIDNFGFVYYVCESLIDIKKTETHLLALFLLPRDPKCKWQDEHIAIIANIKKQAVSPEVVTVLYQKYVLSDFKVREYVK